jgi:hypothetical protein
MSDEDKISIIVAILYNEIKQNKYTYITRYPKV